MQAHRAITAIRCLINDDYILDVPSLGRRDRIDAADNVLANDKMMSVVG